MLFPAARHRPVFVFDKFRAGHRLAEIANGFGIDEENQLPQFREAKVIHPRVLPEINNELRKFLPVNHGGNFALHRRERNPGLVSGPWSEKSLLQSLLPRAQQPQLPKPPRPPIRSRDHHSLGCEVSANGVMELERLAEDADRVLTHFLASKKLRPHLSGVQPQLFVSSDLRSVIRDVLLKRQLGSFLFRHERLRFSIFVFTGTSSSSSRTVAPQTGQR